MPKPEELKTGRAFDEIAQDYDEYKPRDSAYDRVRALATQTIRAAAPRTVADVGCGGGNLLRELAPHIERGVGFDVGERMLEIAREQAAAAGIEHLSFQMAGFSDLAALAEDPEQRYDVVTSLYAMHHLQSEEKRAAVDGMARLARPDGGLVVLADQMCFDDPEAHREDWRITGYDPSMDFPEPIDRLVEMFEKSGLTPVVTQVHPLVGLITARR